MNKLEKRRWAENLFVKFILTNFAMSRIGKKIVELPDGVSATIDNNVITVKGSKGELVYTIHPDVTVSVEEEGIICVPREGVAGRAAKHSSALWGTTRARIANIVRGVSEGFEKKLELHGVGYRASMKGKDVELVVGYSHPVLVEALEGIEFAVDKEVITVSGIDNVLVGQVAADIRAIRKPEPYKGKGVRYQGEHVRRKVGKVVGAAAA